MHLSLVLLAAQALTGTVDLVWVDPTSAAPFAYASARAESTEALEEAGIGVQWRRAAASEVLRPDEVAVVLLPGTSPHSGPDHRIVGATQNGEDAISAVWIYVEELRATLDFGGRPPEAWSGAERSAFGRALGRVAAHEAIHVLLPHLPHAASGLMSARTDRTSLLARRIAVDENTRTALRGSLISSSSTLQAMNLAAQTHLAAASPSVHGLQPVPLLPSAPCPTSSDPFRRVAPTTSSAETLPVSSWKGPTNTADMRWEESR